MGIPHSIFVILALAAAAACTAENDLKGLNENSANSTTGASAAAPTRPSASDAKVDPKPIADSGSNTQGTSANGNTLPGVETGSGDNASSTTDYKVDSVVTEFMGSSTGDAGGSSTSEVGSGTPSSNLLWMAMGDQPLAQLTQIAECTSSENIARSACSTQNALCRGKFEVTCDTSTDCRRLFKCTTGTSAGLMWFAMGDTTAAGTFPQCSKTSNIAGSDCNTQNDRCLSQFLTATGNPRLFKCLPSGGPGLLFWRWIEDKTAAELASFATCTTRENVAGTSCSSENSKCKSQFCVEGIEPNCTKLRLFKCTP
jgi:hypothetical protein